MSLCNKCQSKGLPIYPVRYAVAPDYTQAKLPAWAEKKQLPNLSAQSKYVLRTMRKGYLYVFSQYDTAPLYLDLSVYAVDEQGGFWQQDISKELDLLQFNCDIVQKQQPIPLSDSPTSCNNSAHSSSNIAFITIDKPEQCDTVWLVFSEHKWSYATLEQYFYDNDKRNARAQVVKPKQWLSVQKSQDGITIADEHSITTTMDITLLNSFSNDLNSLAYNKPLLNSHNFNFSYPYLYAAEPLKEDPISNSTLNSEPFKYNKLRFTKRNTLTPWPHMPAEMRNQTLIRSNYSTHLANKMNALNRNSTGCPPMMVALIDSIGIAAELSSWGNNAINSVKKVITERQRENATFSGIQLLEETIKNSDYADNEDKFFEDLNRKNKAYLSDARLHHSDGILDNHLLRTAEDNGIKPWDTEQKAKGKRVIDIIEQSNSPSQSKVIHPFEINGSYAYSVPPLEDIYPDKFNAYYLKDDAISTLKSINENYLIETIGEPKYSNIFDETFKLEDDSDMLKIKRLKNELSALNADFSIKAAIYKRQWHQQHQTQLSGEQRWRKYQACLNNDYEIYKKEYAIFIEDTDNYISGLLDDLIVWVNGFSQNSQQAFALAADDLERDSDNYLAFANDILMTLGMQAESDKVSQLFTQLIEDSALDGHNIVWSSVLAGRKLDKTAQRKCVNFLLSLNKNSVASNMSYGQLLDKLSTVINFYSGSSIENDTVIDLAGSINAISGAVFTAPPKPHNEIVIAKEMASLLNSKRGAIGEENSPQAQISAAYIKPIKEASAAALMPLLKYLQHVSGNISSEFAQAWFVAAMPGRLSKGALSQLMATYEAFASRLKQEMVKDVATMGNKLAAGYQQVAELTKNALSSRLVGGALVSGLLGYQLFTMYHILSDRTLKTHTQQTEANLQLSVAATASVSLSFRLVAIYGEHNRLSESLLGNVKFLGNFFGFISGLAKATSIFGEDNKGKSATEKGLSVLSYITEIIGTVDLFFQLGKTSLIEFVNTKLILILSSLKSAYLRVFVTLFTERFLMGFLLIAINPWVSLGIFLIQLLIELNKDDDMQIWLRRCRFGKAQLRLDRDYDDRYLSSEQEVKELKAIFEKFQQQTAEYQTEQDAIEAKARQKEINSLVSPSDWQNLHNMHW
ncbi:T6SS effector BTH_I2691 family protein [Orbus sturtevantii]|uniref:T6SS effector BTH_I2691 family protein n=1 Tax=Orbus sturtevantii TaxID=3074109 RepID=UPI00370D8579